MDLHQVFERKRLDNIPRAGQQTIKPELANLMFKD